MGVVNPDNCTQNPDCVNLAAYVGWDVASPWDSNYALMWGTEGPTFTTILRTLNIDMMLFEKVSFLTDMLQWQLTPKNNRENCIRGSVKELTSLDELQDCYFVIWAAAAGSFPDDLVHFSTLVHNSTSTLVPARADISCCRM